MVDSCRQPAGHWVLQPVHSWWGFIWSVQKSRALITQGGKADMYMNAYRGGCFLWFSAHRRVVLELFEQIHEALAELSTTGGPNTHYSALIGSVLCCFFRYQWNLWNNHCNLMYNVKSAALMSALYRQNWSTFMFFIPDSPLHCLTAKEKSYWL